MHTKRIAHGAAWMDRHAPADWYRRIDTERLNQTDRGCVIGQVFGDFDTYTERRFLLGWLPDGVSRTQTAIQVAGMFLWPGSWALFAWMGSNGFASIREQDSEWREAWATEIHKRILRDQKREQEAAPLRWDTPIDAPLYVSDIVGEEQREQRGIATR